MKVHWTATAEAHLDGIYQYIALNSEFFALRTLDRITRCSEQLADFPLIGSQGARVRAGSDSGGFLQALQDHLSHQAKPDRCTGSHSQQNKHSAGIKNLIQSNKLNDQHPRHLPPKTG